MGLRRRAPIRPIMLPLPGACGGSDHTGLSAPNAGGEKGKRQGAGPPAAKGADRDAGKSRIQRIRLSVPLAPKPKLLEVSRGVDARDPATRRRTIYPTIGGADSAGSAAAPGNRMDKKRTRALSKLSRCLERQSGIFCHECRKCARPPRQPLLVCSRSSCRLAFHPDCLYLPPASFEQFLDSGRGERESANGRTRKRAKWVCPCHVDAFIDATADPDFDPYRLPAQPISLLKGMKQKGLAVSDRVQVPDEVGIAYRAVLPMWRRLPDTAHI